MFASTGARSRLVQMTVCRGGTIGVRCRPAQRRTPGGHARRPGIPTRHFKPQTGAPGGIRTPDQWLRKPLLYPAELQAPGRLLSTIEPACASRVRFAHFLRTFPYRPRAALAGAAGPVREADPRRPPDRLAAAAWAARSEERRVGEEGGCMGEY